MGSTGQRPLDSHQPTDGFQNGLRSQNTNQKRQRRSWMFRCWRSQNSDTEEASNAFHNKSNDRTGHQEYRAKKLAELQRSGPPVSDTKPNEVKTESGVEQVEEGSVDKEAEEFIDKMRRKMNMEALKSMKRYESMMRKGY